MTHNAVGDSLIIGVYLLLAVNFATDNHENQPRRVFRVRRFSIYALEQGFKGGNLYASQPIPPLKE